MISKHWILVPIDFSHDSRLALEEADRQAAETQAGLILLHVKTAANSKTRLAIESESLAQWVRYIHRTPPNQVAYRTVDGDPADEILRMAKEYEVTKIIMGRGRDDDDVGIVARTVGDGFHGTVQMISRAHSDAFIGGATVD